MPLHKYNSTIEQLQAKKVKKPDYSYAKTSLCGILTFRRIFLFTIFCQSAADKESSI